VQIDWRYWLINRVTITLGAITFVVLAWNLYIAAHDDGVLTGSVVGPDGDPVPGATVTLWQQAVTTLVVQDQATTDEEGRFRFEDHGQFAVILAAEKAGLGNSPRRRVDRYFRNQNRHLDQPLQIQSREG
jgi:hypothetical protein